MSKILVIGATGGVGHRLCPLLLQRGHEVRGLHRKPEQAEWLRSLGVQPQAGDILEMSDQDLEQAMVGCDVVVFSAGAAGSGRDRTSAIDGDGPVRIIDAARRVGLERFYLVSAFPESCRGGTVNEGFEHYMREKKRADVAVAASGLDWVILRPGTLLDAEGDGLVNAGLALEYGNVARGNVAGMLAELIDHPEIRREIIELTDGKTPIPQAVSALVRQ